jgi:hypothetical protein
MKGKKRHDFIYRTLWRLFRHAFAKKFNFEYDEIKVEQTPYIVVSNHLTNWDPILIGLSFGKNMYYVATDQIFRMGWKSRLLTFCFAPIAKAKTSQESQTVITIFRRLKENCNICIFAEGITSSDGETGEIQPAIAKLVKRAGVTLVTYKFLGSYFTFPKWAHTIRKGKMEGRLAQIYSPEKIASMTENEIFTVIKNDIYVNAYAEQEKNMLPFRGKNKAEHLEIILYCCPKCRKFSTLSGRGDILFCTCGYKLNFSEYGYFQTPDEKEPPVFTTILDWTKWQRKEIEALVLSSGSMDSSIPIFTDLNQELVEVEKSGKNNLISKGKLCLYGNRLSIISDSGREIDFPLENIIDVSAFSVKRLIFSTKDGKFYEINSKHPKCALKYLDFFKAVKSNKKEQ